MCARVAISERQACCLHLGLCSFYLIRPVNTLIVVITYVVLPWSLLSFEYIASNRNRRVLDLVVNTNLNTPESIPQLSCFYSIGLKYTIHRFVVFRLNIQSITPWYSNRGKRNVSLLWWKSLKYLIRIKC